MMVRTRLMLQCPHCGESKLINVTILDDVVGPVMCESCVARAILERDSPSWTESATPPERAGVRDASTRSRATRPVDESRAGGLTTVGRSQRPDPSPAGQGRMRYGRGRGTERRRPKRVGQSDAQLVAALRAGDEETYRLLVREWNSSLLRVAQMFVPSSAVAEEVVQETWLRVLGAVDRFEGRSSLKTWVFRILVNTAKTRAQREGRSLPFSALSDPARDPEAAVPAGPLPARRPRAVPGPLVVAAARPARGAAARCGDPGSRPPCDRAAAPGPARGDLAPRRRGLGCRGCA